MTSAFGALDAFFLGHQHEPFKFCSALVAPELKNGHENYLSATASGRRLPLRAMQFRRRAERALLDVDSTILTDYLHCVRISHNGQISDGVGFVSVSRFIQNQSHRGTASTESSEVDSKHVTAFKLAPEELL